MEDFENIKKKYLFKLSMLNENMTVMEYIEKVLSYEEANNCHVNNKQFHEKKLFFNILEMEDTYGKITSIK